MEQCARKWMHHLMVERHSFTSETVNGCMYLFMDACIYLWMHHLMVERHSFPGVVHESKHGHRLGGIRVSGLGF
jgi:hypothetical protein